MSPGPTWGRRTVHAWDGALLMRAPRGARILFMWDPRTVYVGPTWTLNSMWAPRGTNILFN